MAQVIARTRDKTKAERTARMLAGTATRCIGVRKFDARTWEVFTQADVTLKELNALQTLTRAFHNLPEN